MSPPLDTGEPKAYGERAGWRHDEIRQLAGQQQWIICRGKRVTLKTTGHTESVPSTSTRGVIQTFSPRARRRMLVRIAEIDWRAAGSTLFVTLTYPPECEDHTPAERSRHRALMQRHIERHLGGPVGQLWRVEWKERLSGPTRGQWAPHIHQLYFGVRFLGKRWLAEKWRECLGCMTVPVVDVQRCDGAKKVQVYIAKYCSKSPDVLLLDNVPYRHRTGRHAGWLRVKEIPMHPLKVYRVRLEAVLAFLASRASETMPHYDARYAIGFTALGCVAVEFSEDLAKFVLDGSIELVYAE
jgi:hypothetical protein